MSELAAAVAAAAEAALEAASHEASASTTNSLSAAENFLLVDELMRKRARSLLDTHQAYNRQRVDSAFSELTDRQTLTWLNGVDELQRVFTLREPFGVYIEIANGQVDLPLDSRIYAYRDP